jgi:hypothetical protein
VKSWSSTQATVPTSVAEAEFYALTRAGSECLGLKSLLSDLGWEERATLRSDSTAAMGVAKRQGAGKWRHVQVKYLWLQEITRRGDLCIQKVDGRLNVSDMLTKYLSGEDIRRLVELSGMERTSSDASSEAARSEGGCKHHAHTYPLHDHVGSRPNLVPRVLDTRLAVSATSCSKKGPGQSTWDLHGSRAWPSSWRIRSTRWRLRLRSR